MSLGPGVWLGPYEILSPLGAGGMGEVYRARDTRLARDVAVKVLPGEVVDDPRALARFVNEARAVAALSHPGIVSIFDIGEDRGIHYAVTELLEGETLRALVDRGPVPARRALEITLHVAEALAAAHESGIVHRDVKPGNLFVTKDGRLKVLDFGLAKNAREPEPEESTASAEIATKPGTVLGTVAYMSPEQARGLPVDFRSDQFSLGAVLYEMLAGKRPFSGASAAETLAAIIREEPEPLEKLAPAVPPPIRWVVERCLAKEPGERFDSTRDLVRELATLRLHLSEFSAGSMAGAAGPPPRRWRRTLPLLAGAVCLLSVGGLVAILLDRSRPSPPAVFHRLTWRRGALGNARFARDGRTILYSAAWDGKAPALFLKHPESADAVALDVPSAELLAISPSGGATIQLDPREAHFGVTVGTLATVPLTGGTPREIADSVNQADWRPGGTLVVVRDARWKGRLESPPGNLLYETPGHVSYPRASPRNDLIAFADHPVPNDDRGAIAVVDLRGRKRTLTREFESIQGIAWSSSGEEVWFAAAEAGHDRQLWGVTLAGRLRLVAQLPGDLRLQDVAPSGQVLLTSGEIRNAIRWRPSGEDRERDLSWYGFSMATDISPDGRTIVFLDQGAPSGANYAICLWRVEGGPVRLGEGSTGSLSPDGRWVASTLPKAGRFTIGKLPTGAGEPRPVNTDGLTVNSGQWLPDGGLVLCGTRDGAQWQLFRIGSEGDPPRPLRTVEPRLLLMKVSPDGSSAACSRADGSLWLYPLGAGEPRRVAGAIAGDLPIEWNSDGRSLLVQEKSVPGAPARLFFLEISTGRRTFWRQFYPDDPSGVSRVAHIHVTRDGRSYTYSYLRRLSVLYLAEGLR